MSSIINLTKQQEQRKIRNTKYYNNGGKLLHKILYLQAAHTFPSEINELPTTTPANKLEKYRQMLNHTTALKLTALGIKIE